ncbi:SusE outer membrane protein [Filimonas lacunae]|uniref:SusE outer membrane protein n=1 Tax=Filimonas lacunae TaxID=477680 RepID=A0A173MRI5_9BACT|nr:SusE domain-containing protein [Filimonas lacunae]BAV10060.1 hypothetical protein FLA_6115 [Filimonas lacunae]SIS83376.1 SusE outer membrane protein [Filimonas lacunae]
MKKWFNIFLFAGAVVAYATACKKDESRAVLGAQNASKISTSVTSALVLDSFKASTTVASFNWTEVKYGYSAAVTYSLEFGLASDNFANPTTVEIGNDIFTKGFTHAQLDTILYQTTGLAANVASQVQVRVRADVNKGGSASGSSTVEPVYSDTLVLTVTPYAIVIKYPTIYAPGAYQGWSPPTAHVLNSVKSDNNYEGYINFPAGSLEFKITPDSSWAVSYGVLNGALSTSGSAANLSVPSAGYYRVAANMSTAVWSVTKTTWGLTGTATSGGTTTDTQMTFDAATETWSVVTNLVAGSFKFRANSDGTKSANLFGLQGTRLSNGGIPIQITTAGSYTVKLNLSAGAGYYTYSVQKN